VARLGGDEFGVLLADVAGAEHQLSRLRELVNDVIIVSGLPVAIEASIGFAVAPYDGRDADTLLQHADVAMYIAKSSHARIVRYDPAEDHYDALDLSLIGEFPSAIDSGQLVLHYQPKRGILVIVRSIVDLGHNLALRVVAEGVETEAVLSGLRTAGCDVAQGYLFARAMPPDELVEWLASDERQRRAARVTPGQPRLDVPIG